MAQEGSVRPWGRYEILVEERRYKVKRIFVNGGSRLSLQRHERRTEHWVIAAGHGRVVIGDEVVDVGVGDSVDVPPRTVHRIENVGTEPLVFVEVQTGSYFGEDDIERLEDDYGRA